MKGVSKKVKKTQKTKGRGGALLGNGIFGSRRAPQFTLLKSSSADYKRVLSQYDATWDKSRCQPTPVRAIYEVKVPNQWKQFSAFQHSVRSVPKRFQYAGAGNTLRRYHGTAMRCRFAGSPCSDPKCSVCRILHNGFDPSQQGRNGGGHGPGLFFTSQSNTAKCCGLKHGYSYQLGNFQDPNAGNCILVCSVVCGNCEIVNKSTSRPIDRTKYNSRCINKGSNVDELVIPTGRQVLPRFVICF